VQCADVTLMPLPDEGEVDELLDLPQRVIGSHALVKIDVEGEQILLGLVGGHHDANSDTVVAVAFNAKGISATRPFHFSFSLPRAAAVSV